MEDKYLKDKLSQIQPIYEPIDLEESIMRTIENHANYQQQILKYKRLGRISLMVSICIFGLYGLSLLMSAKQITSSNISYQIALILLAFALIITQLEGSRKLKKIKL